MTDGDWARALVLWGLALAFLSIFGVILVTSTDRIDDRLISLQHHTPTPNVQALQTRVAELERTPTP